jgi:hypothetical protein
MAAIAERYEILKAIRPFVVVKLVKRDDVVNVQL